MLRNARDTYVDFCASYAARDLERCARLVSDDVVFALYIDRDLAPFGGVSIGRGIMHQRWQMVAQAFDLLRYDVAHVVEEADKLRGLVAYRFRHKATGEDIAGVMRHVIQPRDGLMARIEEHHDRTRVEAFFRLIQSITPADAPPVQPAKPDAELPAEPRQSTRTSCDTKA